MLFTRTLIFLVLLLNIGNSSTQDNNNSTTEIDHQPIETNLKIVKIANLILNATTNGTDLNGPQHDKGKNEITIITTSEDDDCPILENLDDLTQEQFTLKLTDACRYDKLIKPRTTAPLPIYVQVDLAHIESADQMQFTAHMMVQYRYRDVRLRYDHISPKRGTIIGEEILRNKIWVPHMIMRNERDTTIMGIDGKDVFVSISPKGNIVYYYRMTANYYCWMNLKKFPFDSQYCELRWNSWTYNTSNILLRWDRDNPVKVAENLHLTEFVLTGTWTEESEVMASFNEGPNNGYYSELIFKFKLSREVGYYIMDYFLPSILLVCTSWVSFWLQADASPARACLGTSTMLAFITLNGSLTKNLPKVSYIKASEVWFFTCACFIFSSLAEFAFVNVIWRRRKKVELKKPSSKHILKGALTPSVARKQLRKAESLSGLFRTVSCSNISDKSTEAKNIHNNYLTVHNFPNSHKTQSQDELVKSQESVVSISIPENQPTPISTWHTMTPQEVAIWIDRKSRVIFPASFLIFNIFYWSFVYIL